MPPPMTRAVLTLGMRVSLRVCGDPPRRDPDILWLPPRGRVRLCGHRWRKVPVAV
jgi:hypothetical protein